MQVNCPGCNAANQTEAGPGAQVKCEKCGMGFCIPIPKTAEPEPINADREINSFLFGGNFAAEIDRLEGVMVEVLGGPEAFQSIKDKAVAKFGEFIAELEADPAIDVEKLGRAFVENTAAAPIAAPDGEASSAAVSLIDLEAFEMAIRRVVREEMAEALDDFNEDMAALFDTESGGFGIQLEIGEQAAEVRIGSGDDWTQVLLAPLNSPATVEIGPEQIANKLAPSDPQAGDGAEASSDDLDAAADLPTG